MLIIFWVIFIIMMVFALACILIPLIKQSPKNIFTAFCITLALPIISTLLYFRWGSSPELIQYYGMKQNAQLVKKEWQQFKSPQQLIIRLQAILKTRPNSARGWYLLGRLYMSQNEFQKAANVFAKANQLQPHDPTIMLQYAESIFFRNNEKLLPKTKQLLHEVLQKIPNEPDAINLLAILAYHQQKYQLAVDYWEQLLNIYPPDSTNNKMLLAAIANAQKKIQKDQIDDH